MQYEEERRGMRNEKNKKKKTYNTRKPRAFFFVHTLHTHTHTAQKWKFNKLNGAYAEKKSVLSCDLETSKKKDYKNIFYIPRCSYPFK